MAFSIVEPTIIIDGYTKVFSMLAKKSGKSLLEARLLRFVENIRAKAKDALTVFKVVEQEVPVDGRHDRGGEW